MFWLGKSIKTKGGNKMGVSPIEYIILAHLRRRELLNKKELGQYGNELIRELNELFAGSWQAQSGTIYPLLSKMYKKDLVDSVMKKTPLGPKKKVYTLSETGRGLIDQIIHENYEADELFIEKYLNLLAPFKEYFESLDDEEINALETEQDDPGENFIICEECGYKSPTQAAFCAGCGSKLNQIVIDSESEKEES